MFERREVMTEARSSLDALEDRCAACLKTVKDAKSQTREIVTLLHTLGADISFNSPRKADGSRKTDRRGTVMGKMQNHLNDQQQKSDHGEMDGELEERTGYSTVVTNRANAAASRAIT